MWTAFVFIFCLSLHIHSTEPDTRVCGSSCYNTRHFSCCERNKEKSKGCCATGRGADAAPAVYNPHTHVCCDGCLSERRPPIDLSHGSTEQHCCGTGVYWPHTEICCDGHSHQRKENTHCCGVKAYNIKNTRMKCCAGTLYNLTGGHEAQCCGSLLLTPPNVCCSSEDMEVLYAAKTGFGCCDHSYYNATLWSCCAGKLSPVHQPAQQQMIKESRLLSVNNLNEADLCEKMQIGTVQSVSPHSIVFINVLKINGRDATVTALASPHILKTPDRCSSPKLTPGKTYFLNKVNVFTDFNHESIPQSLHFITSKCKRPVTTSS
ncbi:uncharacterized protein LOC141771639 [Sebastes fasciatus]|uniref:uncharacterized protein LOC141771639 n=1 Tax=Sebastes fasciatus TaxID=394691 RepID=UPI003D9F3779